MTEVGFEPTPPERLEPKSSALDHSATLPCVESVCIADIVFVYRGLLLTVIHNSLLFMATQTLMNWLACLYFIWFLLLRCRFLDMKLDGYVICWWARCWRAILILVNSRWSTKNSRLSPPGGYLFVIFYGWGLIQGEGLFQGGL